MNGNWWKLGMVSRMWGHVSGSKVLVIIGAVIATVFVIMTFVPGTAIAAERQPPASTRPASPGSGYVWGANRAVLGTAGPCSEGHGGWDKLYFKSMDSPIVDGKIGNPVSIRLGEVHASGTNAYSMRACTVSAADARAASERGTTRYAVGTRSGLPTRQSIATCATTEWSLPSSWFSVNVSGSTESSGTSGAASDTSALITQTGITSTTCPYLVSLRVPVQTWQTESADGVVTIATWGADTWYRQQLYNLIDPIDVLCATPVGASLPVCITRTEVDGTNFAVVCANAPALLWNDWSTLGSWVGHYANCLFNPLNGFDRNGQVAQTWESSSAAPILGALNTAVDQFQFSSTCGVIFDYDLLGSPLRLNTCSLAVWGDFRTALGWIIYVLSAVGLLYFLIKIITGIFNKKTPNPLAGENDE